MSRWKTVGIVEHQGAFEALEFSSLLYDCRLLFCVFLLFEGFTQFSMEGLRFQLIDVGGKMKRDEGGVLRLTSSCLGQRGEREKWIRVFQDVTAVLFISALSEYNQVIISLSLSYKPSQVLDEDRSTNRLLESLNLFGTIVGNPYFLDSGIILFLNKEDIFYKKIEVSHLADYLET